MIYITTCELKLSLARWKIWKALELMGPCCRISDTAYLVSTKRSQKSIAATLSEFCESGGTFSVEVFNPANADALPKHAQRWLSSQSG